MKKYLVSIATPAPSRTWRTVEAADHERAAHSARTAANADPCLRGKLLRITVYEHRETADPAAWSEWVAVWGLIDAQTKLHSGNL